MELQIQDLVNTIKKDGIEAAKTEADNIIEEAKKKASAIISDALEEAEKIRKKSESEIIVLKESAKTAAEHAQRDAMLSFRRAVQTEFEKLLAADISKSFNPNILTKLIVAAINNEQPEDYAVEVSEMTDELKSELAEKIREGLEIKVNPNVRTGFRLQCKDGSGYFDCSDEELTQMLMPFFPDIFMS